MIKFPDIEKKRKSWEDYYLKKHIVKVKVTIEEV